jgi:fido (protein-threonine AMPylation protein)
MARTHEKLAASLTALQALQKGGRRVFQSKELSRADRERLLKNGFVQEAIKSWLISSSPSTRAGDSTPWYASFWEFCARYCEARFRRKWHLSPEQSLLLQAEKNVIPTQVIVYTPKGTNNKVELLFGTSLYDLKQPGMPAAADLTVRDGLRLFSPAAALLKVPETFFARNPIEARIVLAGIGDASEVLRRLLDGGHSVVAGRLAGAFRRVDRVEIADEIIANMKAAGHAVRESDPFSPRQLLSPLPATEAPIVGRLRALWESTRGDVLKIFPQPPGLPRAKKAYLQSVDEIYRNDAYHSLSIEGYSVSPDLIDRVQAGAWNPAAHEADRQNRDALAARGYWQAFQIVKANVGKIVSGANPGELVRTTHRDWYRELFQPCVAAGLIAPSALAGYRNHAVYLRGSRYAPPRSEAVRDAMPALFELLAREPEPAVRAVLGHWLFGYIHPYPDGNGRMARFLMNAMLASGGYPWTIVQVGDRDTYLHALDRASIDSDIGPFVRFIAKCVKQSTR